MPAATSNLPTATGVSSAPNASNASNAPKQPKARQSLISPGSILPAATAPAPPEVGLLETIVKKDGARHGRLVEPATEEPEEPELPQESQSPNPVDTGIRTSVNTDFRKPVRTEASTDGLADGSTHGREQASTEASPQARTPVSAQVGTSVRPPIDEFNADDGLAAMVRAAIGIKRTHSGGVKATVDMSPELSLRAKRYGLDHGNVAVRVMLIELLDAYLTGEGY